MLDKFDITFVLEFSFRFANLKRIYLICFKIRWIWNFLLDVRRTRWLRFQFVMISLLTLPHLETLFMFQKLVNFHWIFFCYDVKLAFEWLELVHSDIFKPMTTCSHWGAKYFLTFLDAISTHRSIRFAPLFLINDSMDDAQHISMDLFFPQYYGALFRSTTLSIFMIRYNLCHPFYL